MVGKYVNNYTNITYNIDGGHISIYRESIKKYEQDIRNNIEMVCTVCIVYWVGGGGVQINIPDTT